MRCQNEYTLKLATHKNQWNFSNTKAIPMKRAKLYDLLNIFIIFAQTIYVPYLLAFICMQNL